jgi:CTP:molybdopterin cytidylyltransferase MocA
MESAIAGIVLAAGASRRMGRPKALLPIADDTFVTRLVRTLRQGGADTIVVVVGAEADAIAAALEHAGAAATIAVNPRPEDGQLSSLVVGIEALSGVDAAGALVCLVDAPLVRAATVARLIETFRRTGAPIVRPRSGDRHGHPVLFSRALFDELRCADRAVGAKAVVRAHTGEIAAVDVDDEGAFVDIDTPDEYRRWIEAGIRDSGLGIRND